VIGGRGNGEAAGWMGRMPREWGGGRGNGEEADEMGRRPREWGGGRWNGEESGFTQSTLLFYQLP